MEEPKDKRTKEWKEWKAKFDESNTEGLGDLVEKVTKATGIKKAVEFFTPEGEDCGCDKRKEKLNDIRFNFKMKPQRCFTEETFNMWTEFRKKKPYEDITHDEQVNIILKIHIQLFGRSFQPTSCCIEAIQPYINNINLVYEAY